MQGTYCKLRNELATANRQHKLYYDNTFKATYNTITAPLR